MLSDFASATKGNCDIAAYKLTHELVRTPTQAERLEGLPDDVQKALQQAETNYDLPGHEEAAATMYRRALERALKYAHPEVTGNLNAKIKKLAETHIIPQSLAEWAHQIRLDGNDGAHDDQVTREQLTATRAFTDALLRYLIVLPKMVERRRAETHVEPPAADGAEG